MIKSFDVPISTLPYIGCDNTNEINNHMKNLGLNDSQIISVIKILINPDPVHLLPHEIQRIFYKEN